MKKWLKKLAGVLGRLTGKVVEAFSALAGNAGDVILSFICKRVGFVTEHTRALIAFVAGLSRVRDYNWTRTHNHLVHKRTLNFLAKLAMYS